MRIGLCMIMKDESHIVHEVLNSVHEIIDTFCIVDTGSTDNTIQIVKDFFESKKIEGEIHERPWIGFGENRSEALKLCNGKMDYILMIDADDLMGFPGIGARAFLEKALTEISPNACNLTIRRGNLEYTRTQIFKADDNWRYVGVLHEYPTNDSKTNKFLKLPPEIYMVGRTLGNRSKIEGNKYARDAEVLLKALETEPNNDRYVFYLAQSYRDAGMNEEAVKWYKKRFEMGGWNEELFVVAYNVSKLTDDKEWAWKATEKAPYRSEALVSYVSQRRAKAEWSQELLSMIMYASTIPKPSQECLFIETDVYAWRVWDELSIVAAYCGKKDLAKDSCIRVLSEKKYPPEQKPRLEANLKAML